MPRQGPFDPRAFRIARLAAGLTQHELARELGVAGGERVSRWELGLSVPRTHTLYRAAKVLAVDVGQLIGTSRTPTLGDLRRSRGLTLEQVAREVHASKSTVSRWESGELSRKLPATTIDRLAEVLGVSSAVVQAAVWRESA